MPCTPSLGVLTQMVQHRTLFGVAFRFYESEAELRRLFKSTNGIILPVSFDTQLG